MQLLFTLIKNFIDLYLKITIFSIMLSEMQIYKLTISKWQRIKTNRNCLCTHSFIGYIWQIKFIVF